MDNNGHLSKRYLFLETCLWTGFRHGCHGQRHQGAARGVVHWGRGWRLVIACGARCGLGGRVLSHSPHQGGKDEGWRWLGECVGMRQVHEHADAEEPRGPLAS